MESRAWGACKKRTNLYALKLHKGDYALLAITVVILVVASYFFVFVSIPTVASFFGL
jgi:energy-coupling factor transporter transmembrane protein EcfT